MANPQKIAPPTKYGGNTVECQAETIPTEKSQLTVVCTDTTNGVATQTVTTTQSYPPGPGTIPPAVTTTTTVGKALPQ